MSRLLLGFPILVGLVTSGCLPLYNQQRTALVPHLAPIQTTGAPQQTRVAIGAGATTAADLTDPTLGDQDAGVALPRQQGRAQLSLALTANQSLSAIYELGSSTNPRIFNASLPKPDDSLVRGSGIQWEYSFHTSDERVRVGLAFELMNWQVPWVAKDTCVQDCEFADSTAQLWGTDPVMTMGAAVTPSYRAGDFIAFGGLTVKNHPTLVNEVTNIGHQPAEVKGGPFAAVIAAGVAYEPEKMVQIAVELSQPVTGDPISYGPSVGGWLRVGFGDMPPPRREPITVLVPYTAPQPLVPPPPPVAPPPPAPPPPPLTDPVPAQTVNRRCDTPLRGKRA